MYTNCALTVKQLFYNHERELGKGEGKLLHDFHGFASIRMSAATVSASLRSNYL